MFCNLQDSLTVKIGVEMNEKGGISSLSRIEQWRRKKEEKNKEKMKNMTKKIVKKELQVPENADRRTKVKGV